MMTLFTQTNLLNIIFYIYELLDLVAFSNYIICINCIKVQERYYVCNYVFNTYMHLLPPGQGLFPPT